VPAFTSSRLEPSILLPPSTGEENRLRFVAFPIPSPAARSARQSLWLPASSAMRRVSRAGQSERMRTTPAIASAPYTAYRAGDNVDLRNAHHRRMGRS
jgi:hypothetical protein